MGFTEILQELFQIRMLGKKENYIDYYIESSEEKDDCCYGNLSSSIFSVLLVSSYRRLWRRGSDKQDYQETRTSKTSKEGVLTCYIREANDWVGIRS